MKISELQKSNSSLYSTDKFTGHAYGEFYDKLFEGKECDRLNLLEIGINEGGSVRLWHDYLIESEIHGVDIDNVACRKNRLSYPRLWSKEIDAYSENFIVWLKMISVEINKFFDIIIDDGSHQLYDQIYALKNFPSYLKSGGILVIEDIPSGAETEIIKHAPSGGTVEVINLRHVTGRWDDCLITFKKD